MADWDERIKVSEGGFGFLWKGMKNYWELLGTKQNAMLGVFFATMLTQALALLFAYLLKLIFDEIPAMISSGKIELSLVLLIIATFVVKFVNQTFRIFVKEFIFSKGIIYLENYWPVLAQEKLLALSSSFHERENVGKKVSKIEKGCERLVQLTMDLGWNWLPELFYLVLNLIVILLLDWRIGLAFIVPFLPVMFISRQYYLRFEDRWEIWEKKKEKASGYFCQSLLNVKTVQDCVQEDREKNRFRGIRQSMEKLDMSVVMEERYYFYVMRVILDFFFVLSIAYGIYLALTGESTIGTVVYLIATGNVTIENINELFHNYTRILRHLVAVNRMKELLDEKTDITNSNEAIIPNQCGGHFSFENVTFTYPGKDRPVLANFSMNIKPGEMVAFVGRSGEGKTTLVKLLARVYDLNIGSIKLDGQDIRQFDLSWYRANFAVVQQDVDIFDTTLRDNIRYACPDATDGQVLEALEAAHLNVVINDQLRFPAGLETQVGERGVHLSGGEKQRVGIARAYVAILNGARVLVLDEATSSLDSEAERAIQTMIDKVRHSLNITIVAIAHRLSTIRRADNIYVLQNGQISESGNHERLKAKNGLYAKFIELQQLGELRD